jgi:hypothetical protein
MLAREVRCDGTQLFSNPFNASSLDDIRFGMAPWYAGAADAPTVYGALDNVVVTVVPEPAIFSLLIVAGAAGWILLRRESVPPNLTHGSVG